MAKKSFKKLWMKSPTKCPACNGEREWDGTKTSEGKTKVIDVRDFTGESFAVFAEDGHRVHDRILS